METDTEQHPTHKQPRPTTLDEIRDLAVIDPASTDRPNYAGLMGISKFTAYDDCRSGRVPVIKVGSRYKVKVQELRRQLGDLPQLDSEAAAY